MYRKVAELFSLPWAVRLANLTSYCHSESSTCRIFFKKQEAEHLGMEDCFNYLFLWDGKNRKEKKKVSCVFEESFMDEKL